MINAQQVYTGSVFTSTLASETRLARGRATRNRLRLLYNKMPAEQNYWRSKRNYDAEENNYVHYNFAADALRGSAWKMDFDDEVDGDEEKVGSARIVMHSHR